MNAVFAIPGDLATRTGGYGYDREILARAAAQGSPLRHLELPRSFPYPAAADLAATARELGSTKADAVILIDGLAYGAMPVDLIASLQRRFVALVHHPLGLEAGLDAATAERLLAGERAALALAAHVITTSATTARTLVADFGVAADRLTVAEPGTEPAPRATGSPAGAAPVLLAVGSLVPRKGYDLLIEALGGLLDLPWRLLIAGSAKRDIATAQRLADRIASLRLEERIAIAGELDRPALDAAYDRADIFVSASLYEGYGMAIGEAMARGLALVASTGGAAAETVPDGAGLKVPPGDVAALRRALRHVLSDQALRRSLAEAAFDAGRNLPGWDETAARILSVLRVVGGG